MNCPRCKTGLQTKLYENVETDSCQQCGGIWLDAGELQPILTKRDITFTPSVVEKHLKEAHNSIPQAEQDIVLSCPLCSSSMQPLNYNYSSGVILNMCPNSHGLWFDKEELEKVQSHMEHWDVEKNNEKWSKLQEQTRKNEYDKLDQATNAESNKTGSIGKMIDAIIDMLSSTT